VVKRLRAKGGDYWYTFDCVLPSAPTYVMGSGPAFPTRAACDGIIPGASHTPYTTWGGKHRNAMRSALGIKV